jgi:hypothetical protein
LYEADLRGANDLRNARIYTGFAPGMSSRHDSLDGGIDDDFQLVIYAGCFTGTPEQFRARVREEKSERDARRYLACLSFIESCYQADAEDGVWAQMKTQIETREE